MGLMLGGIEIANAPRLYGHSDGDVVLHALATAILSACGLGDLGRLFPPTDPATKGIASADARVRPSPSQPTGWKVDRAQVSIVGARPRLGGRQARRDGARNRRALVGIEAGSVSVVASTGNLSGAEGAGRVIRATALVTVVRR